jgi:hypothetical protein
MDSWIPNEIEIIFSLARIFISFMRCSQSKGFNKLIFVKNNWPNDPRIGCKFPSNLVDFIEFDANLEDKLLI